MRIYTRRRLYLDDAFLVFGLASLAAATGLVFKFSRDIYIN